MIKRLVLFGFLAVAAVPACAQGMSADAQRQQVGEVCWNIKMEQLPAYHEDLGRLWRSSRDLSSRGTQIHGVVEDARQYINDRYQEWDVEFQELMYRNPSPAACTAKVRQFVNFVHNYVDSVLRGR